MIFSILTNRQPDPDRDYSIGPDGRLRLSTNADAIVDRLYTRLSKWLGDWYLDTAEGIDYKNRILGQSRNGGEISAILRREILLEPGVDQIRSFSLTQNTEDRRGFSVSALVALVDFDEPIAVII